MTCRLYIDEVGNSDLRGSANDDNIRYLSLTGITTKLLAQERVFQPHLDRIKNKYFAGYHRQPVIFHRREMMRGEGPFAVLNDEEVRRAFDADLLEVLESLPYIAVTATIDKREHLDRYSVWHHDPYHYCLKCLVERYVLWLRRNRLTGDVAIEPRFKHADKRVKASFQNIWANGTDNIPARIIQKHLLSRDIKFIAKSHNIAAMQVCDLLAHPSYRAMKNSKLGIDSPADFGTKIVDILIRKKYSRNPKNHQVIDGWGRKWLP